MINVSVVLEPAQLTFLERLLSQGEYRSRSEAVRDFIRRSEFELEWKKTFEECRDKRISVEAERQAASKKLLKRF